jgi:hypothetical protein
MADYRIFQGKTTKQLDSHTRAAADPEGWYYEPVDYKSDVLYSEAYATEEEAHNAADAEFGEYE